MTTTVSEAICKKLLDAPGECTRVSYLRDTFNNNPDEFCQFVGFMKGTLSKTKMRQDKALSIMSDIAIVAVGIGRRDGEADFIRRYGGPELQSFVTAKKQEVTP